VKRSSRLLNGPYFRAYRHSQIEDLFGHLEIISPALAAAGVLILIAGIFERPSARTSYSYPGIERKTSGSHRSGAGIVPAVPRILRSGATISVGMLAGVAKARAESFSFALAVVLTPPVVRT